MTQPKTIKIDNIEYVRADSVQPIPAGNREVIVADRGWTFYGTVTGEDDEHVTLDEGGVVQSYKSLGLPGACADPKGADVVVKEGPRFRVAKRAIISRHAVADGWPK